MEAASSYFRIGIDNSFTSHYLTSTAGHPVTFCIETLVTNMKIHTVFALALGLAAIPAAAQTAAAPSSTSASAALDIKGGEMVWSAEGRRIGRVDRVRGDSIAVIRDMKMIYIPIATLTAGERGLVSTLTSKEINRL